MNRTHFYTQLIQAQQNFSRLRGTNSIEEALKKALKKAGLPDLLDIKKLLTETFSLAAEDLLRNFLELAELREKAWWAYALDFITRARSSFCDFTEGSKIPECMKDGFARRHGLSVAEAHWLVKHTSVWLEQKFFEPLEMEYKFQIG